VIPIFRLLQEIESPAKAGATSGQLEWHRLQPVLDGQGRPSSGLGAEGAFGCRNFSVSLLLTPRSEQRVRDKAQRRKEVDLGPESPS